MPPFRKASSLSQTLVKSKMLKLRALGWTGGATFGKGTCYPGERVGGGVWQSVPGVPRAGAGPA